MPIDMIIREIANWFWFFFQFLLATMLLGVGIYRTREHGRSPIYDALISFGLFLYGAITMRGWVAALLWQQNHGFDQTLKNDYWAASVSVVLGSIIGSYLIYRLTPERMGHWPWVSILVVSWTMSIGMHAVPFMLGLSDWSQFGP